MASGFIGGNRPALARLALAAALLLSALFGNFNPLSTASAASAAARPSSGPSGAGAQALTFIPNAGQTDSAVRFTAQSRGGTLFFTGDAVVLALPAGGARLITNEARLDALDQHSSAPATAAAPVVVRLSFLGASGAAAVDGAQPLPGLVNYFIGRDPAKWHTHLPTYAGLVYHNLYPGVDLQYNGGPSQLKGTYVVAPGADPSRIRWRYDGAAGTQLDPSSGALRVSLPSGAGAPGGGLVELAPAVWQDGVGGRTAVAARYTLDPDGGIHFDLPQGYDRSRPLVLDPSLIYSTYLGGSTEDNGNAVALDSAGNIYVTGLTLSTNFPVSSTLQTGNNGGFDAYVTKLSADGSTLLYSTYLGGTGDNDYGEGIAVDNAGDAYVAGLTDSTDFPTPGTPYTSTAGGGIDGFLSKLDPTGTSLLYSTYLGGNSTDFGLGVGVAPSSGVAYVTGRTNSTNFPIAGVAYQSSNAGGSDGFIARVDTTLSGTASLVYSTYFGGGGDDRGSAISADPATGIVYITGRAGDGTFPTTGSAYTSTFGGGVTDAFVLKFDTTATGTAALDYSTLLGGSDNDRALAIARDGSNNVYVTGLTLSDDFPTTVNALQPDNHPNTCLDSASVHIDCFDDFVAKVNPNASGAASLIYSTYLGGTDDDQAFGLAVDGSGQAVVTGYTNSLDFPTHNAFQPACGWGCGLPFDHITLFGFTDGFVTKLNAAGTGLAWSSYLGGSSADVPTAIARNAASGDLVVVGESFSSDFPLANPYQSFNAGGYDDFITRIADDANLANLSVSGADSPDPAPDGGTLSYTLSIHNAGPSLAGGVRLVGTLPLLGSGVSLDHTLNSQGSCLQPNSTALSCDLGSLANNATATMTVVMDVATFATGPVTSTMSVASRVGDSNGANNTLTLSTALSPLSAPTIITQPLSQTIATGKRVTLTVAATNPLPLTYQWYLGTSGDTSSPVLSATSTSYVTPPLTATNPISYWVRVANIYLSTDSATAVVTVKDPPNILTQPLSQTISAGRSVTLTTVVTGSAPLSYQWYAGPSGDTSLPVGTNAPSYHTPALAGSTRYWVRASNEVGIDDSRTATVTVISKVYAAVVLK